MDIAQKDIAQKLKESKNVQRENELEFAELEVHIAKRSVEVASSIVLHEEGIVALAEKQRALLSNNVSINEKNLRVLKSSGSSKLLELQQKLEEVQSEYDNSLRRHCEEDTCLVFRAVEERESDNLSTLVKELKTKALAAKAETVVRLYKWISAEVDLAANKCLHNYELDVLSLTIEAFKLKLDYFEGVKAATNRASDARVAVVVAEAHHNEATKKLQEVKRRLGYAE